MSKTRKRTGFNGADLSNGIPAAPKPTQDEVLTTEAFTEAAWALSDPGTPYGVTEPVCAPAPAHPIYPRSR